MVSGYVYDDVYLQHETGNHPENASRLRGIMAHLSAIGLLDRLTHIPTHPATLDDVHRVHTPRMVERIRALAERGGGALDADTVLGPRSYDVALQAAGGTLAATRAVLEGEVQSAYALVRPPGHHATPSRSMGFCLLNNVAIAAAWALASGRVSRVAVVDYDLHHGNGTAEIFHGDPRVLYISTHQHPFYPYTGDWRDTGSGRGKGTCLNIALPAGVGDEGYAEATQRLIIPKLRRFGPDLLLASVGYDAHWADPLAWMLLSISGYRRIADALVTEARELCGGRLVFCLEGGYHPEALAYGVATTLCAMLDRHYDDPLGAAHEPEAPVSERIEAIARLHQLD